jgi:hypothetical protein
MEVFTAPLTGTTQTYLNDERTTGYTLCKQYSDATYEALAACTQMATVVI